MTYYIVVVGPAGSGKSYLTSALADWMQDQQLGVAILNLDPAAEWLPYSPDIDVREYVNSRYVMQKYNLGPNGALIVSVDMLVNYVDKLKDEIDSIKPNYLIIDTPGQLELFAFRKTGPLVLDMLVGDSKVVSLFLIDGTLALSPSTYASLLILSASVYVRLRKPQINVVTKTDLIPKENLEKMMTWNEDPFEFSNALRSETSNPLLTEFTDRMREGLASLELSWIPVFVSSKTGEGLDILYGEIQRILCGGEDFLTEEPSPRL